MNHHLHLLNLQTGAAGKLGSEELLNALSHLGNGDFSRETEEDSKQKAFFLGLEAHPKGGFREFLGEETESKLRDRVGGDEDLPAGAGLAEEL